MRVIVAGATVRYGPRTVFADLDAEIPDGSIACIVGPSGSGKSTLLGCLAGLQRPSGGSIALTTETGEAAPHPSFATWVPQSAVALDARSVMDNVCIGALAEGSSLPAAVERSLDAIEQVGLTGLLSTPVRALSGGEKQRLALARGLATRRRLILVDEPSAGLDESNTRRIADVLARLRTDSTVVIATHDPLLVGAADTVVSLR